MFNIRARGSPEGDEYIAYGDVVVRPARDGGSLRNVDWVPDGSNNGRQQ